MDWRNPHPADADRPEPEPEPGDWRNPNPADFDKTGLDDVKAGPPRIHSDPTTPKGWIPGEAARSHAGYHLKKHLDFFAPPPAEIGEVVSAWSTLKIGDPPTLRSEVPAPGKIFKRRLYATMTFMMIIGLFQDDNLILIVTAIVGIVLESLHEVYVRFFLAFRREVSYVGEKGIARITCRGSRSRIEKSEVFAFADADALRSAVTPVSTNLMHTAARWSKVWTNTKGKTIFELSGYHSYEHGDPPESDDPFYLARSAEVAWSLYLLPEVLGRIATDGAYDFPLEKGSFVRIAEGRIEFHSEKRVVEVDRDELTRAELSKGVMQFARVETTRGACEDNGRFRFKYKEIANAKLFLLLLDKLMNVRFAD